MRFKEIICGMCAAFLTLPACSVMADTLHLQGIDQGDYFTTRSACMNGSRVQWLMLLLHVSLRWI